MAPEETDAKQETTKRKKGGMPLKSILVLVAIMVIEGGAFGVWMIFMDPSSAIAIPAGGLPSASADAPSWEFKVLEFQAPNNKTGKLVLYDIEIVIECDRNEENRVQRIRQQRGAHIQDAIRSIISRAEPQHFNEVDLQTLKRQISEVLDDVFGNGVVKEVLIPRCIPYRPNY